MFYSANQKSSVAIFIGKPIPRPDRQPLAKDDDMVKTFPSDRADQPFSMSILPWRLWRGWPVTNSHRMKTPFEYLAVGAITIADDVIWCGPSAAGPR